MIFEWDEPKNQRNVDPHGIHFDYADLVLGSLVHLEIDNRRDYGERRFIAYGLLEDRLMVCVYTKRPPARRIFSLCKANGREQRAHHPKDH